MASGGQVLSFFGDTGGESGSASFVFGDAHFIQALTTSFLGPLMKMMAASLTIDLTDCETGATDEIGARTLNAKTR